MNKFIEEAENSQVKEILIKFFNEVDELFKDMDKLSYEEFKVRSKAMWGLLSETTKIDGSYYMITLYGFDKKAEKLYGKYNKL
jgi:hypothetical protein